MPELTIALTKDDFTLNEAAKAYVYRKDGMMDSDLFKKAVISIHGMLDQIENPELILDNTDFNLDDEGSYQVFYSTSFIIFITNGFSVTDDPNQAPPDTSNSRDFVEVHIPQFMFEQLDSLSIKIDFIDEKLIPEWCVDLSLLYDDTDQILDDIDNIRSRISAIQNNIRMAVVTTTGTSKAYKVATPDDIGTKIGDLLVVIPHITSTSNTVTLAVNNENSVYIYAYNMGLSEGYGRLKVSNWFCRQQPYILLRMAGCFLVVGSPSFGYTGVVNFGYCSDNGDTPSKIATLNRSYIGDDESGGIFGIIFANDNTAMNSKLKISGNTFPVWYGNYCDIVTIDGVPILPSMIKAGKLYLFAFAGRSYQIATTTTGLEKKYILLNPDSDPKLPSPTTSQVGQIVKVKSVDESGKVTETETVDMPSQKTLKWVTVHSSDLTETKRELIISTDTDGKSIADYNPVGLSLIVSTPADPTVESNNGSPWVYPSTTKFDNAIRVIGSISGWKTIARDSAFVFNGGSSAMSCTGNVNTSLPTYKLDGYVLDGVRIFFNSANDHLPVGTHVEVAILCEVEE